MHPWRLNLHPWRLSLVHDLDAGHLGRLPWFFAAIERVHGSAVHLGLLDSDMISDIRESNILEGSKASSLGLD